MAGGTWALSATGGIEPLPAALRDWLMRAIQLDPRNPFPSALEAWAELDRVLHYSDPIGEVAALKSFLTRYQARVAADSAKTAARAAPAPRRAATPRPRLRRLAGAGAAPAAPKPGPQAVVPSAAGRAVRQCHAFLRQVPTRSRQCTPRHPHALTLRSLPR